MMTKRSLNFGFHPNPLEIDVREVGVDIRALPNHEKDVAELRGSTRIEKDWYYAPASKARVFALPKTHMITHKKSDNEEHLKFHLWSFSFFSGLRLSAEEAGFLDATPLKPGTLVDFKPIGNSLSASIDLAERFWITNRSDPFQHRRFNAAVHALFLAQYPHLLQYEEFLYLYIALDACYAIAKNLKSPICKAKHFRRAECLCEYFGMMVPDWARSNDNSQTEIANIRNWSMHEALYMGEPLGFALHGIDTNRNLMRELKALICRFLVALIGGASVEYIQSSILSRQIQSLKLS